MKNKLLLLAFIISVNTGLFSQSKTKVSFYIFPSNATLKVDNKIYNIKEAAHPLIIELKEGLQIIELWAPNYKLIKDTLNVKPNNSNVYKKRLNILSDIFNQYKLDLSKYNQRKVGGLVKKIGLPALNAAGLWFVIDGGSVKNLDDLKTKAELHRDAYSSAISLNIIDREKANFESTRNTYNTKKRRLNNKRVIGCSLIAATSFLSYIIIRNHNKKTKPVRPTYQEKNPLVFESIKINSDFNSALSINFNF